MWYSNLSPAINPRRCLNMKKTILSLSIFFLVIFTTIVKNSTKEIEEKNVTINLVSPGPIKTNMTSGMKAKFFTMDQAISDISKLISKKNKINGKFIWRGRILPLRPDLRGINWLKGKASKEYKKI